MTDKENLPDFKPELRPGCMIILMTGEQTLVLDSYDQVLEKLNEADHHQLIEFDCFTTFDTGDGYKDTEKEPFRLTVNSTAVIEVREITDRIYTLQKEISAKNEEELRRQKESGEIVEIPGVPSGIATFLGRFGPPQPPSTDTPTGE